MNTSDISQIQASPADPLYRAAFEQLPKAAFIVSLQCDILALNQAARKMLGSQSGPGHPPSQGNKPGKPLKLNHLFFGSAEEFRERMIIAVSGGKLTMALREKPANRQHFFVSPLKREPKQLEQFLLVHDEVKHVNKVFEHLRQELLEANHLSAAVRRERDRLQTSYEVLEQFNAVAVHDIKAPLRNISSLLGFIQDDHGNDLPEDARQNLNRARKAATRLSDLVTSLLDHAKSGSAAMNTRTLNLADVLAEVYDSLQSSLTAQGAEIETETPLDSIEGDPVLVRQLLENMINNALKYRSHERTLKISIRREPAGLVVQDNGTGFDNQYNQQIFEPFRRLHGAEEIEGSGLGLATCRDICLRHGWTLEAEGRPNEGARFSIGFGAVQNETADRIQSNN